MAKKWQPIAAPIHFDATVSGLDCQVTFLKGGKNIDVTLMGIKGSVNFSDDEPLLRLCELVEVDEIDNAPISQ